MVVKGIPKKNVLSQEILQLPPVVPYALRRSHGS
jgi:hypothetical protein